MLILSHPVFGEEERRKREKELGFARDQVLVGFAPHFLLLRDLTTWKRRFEEAKIRKSNPNLIFCDFRFGEKALTWEKRVFIDSKPPLELFCKTREIPISRKRAKS